MTAPVPAGDVRGRVEAFVADLEAQGFELRYSSSPDGLRFSVDVRLPPAPAEVTVELVGGEDVPLGQVLEQLDARAGRIVPADGLELMCCGCAWTAVARSYAQLVTLAAGHDDAPSQSHIVRLAAGGRFPDDQESFAAELERVRAL